MNQTVTLKIAGVQEEVVVNETNATDDRRGNSFTTTLEQAEIEELPDDPEELAEVLTQMAGAAGAVFRSTVFVAGDCLRETRSGRSVRTTLSADNHDAGRTQIEIITRPNVIEWNGNASLNYRGDEMNARNAFATSETPEQNRQFNMGLRGPLVKGKTSIRLNVDGRRDQQSDTITALDQDGNRRGDVVFRPSNKPTRLWYRTRTDQGSDLRLSTVAVTARPTTWVLVGSTCPNAATTAPAAITRCAPRCKG